MANSNHPNHSPESNELIILSEVVVLKQHQSTALHTLDFKIRSSNKPRLSQYVVQPHFCVMCLALALLDRTNPYSDFAILPHQQQ